MTNRIGDTKHNIYCSIGEWKLRFLAVGSCLNERTLKTDVDEGVAFWWRAAEKDTSCWILKAFWGFVPDLANAESRHRN